MSPEQLRLLRESRGMTREALATELGDCSASTINKWERGMHDIPQWVEEKMLRSTTVKFPLSELHELLDLAREEKIDFGDLLSEGIKLVMEKRRLKSSAPSPVKTGATPATPAATASNISKMPAQHFLAADDSAATEELPPPKKVSYGSGKKRAK